MPTMFQAVEKVNPSFTLPGVLIRQTQKSAYRHILAGGLPEVRLGPIDYVVYLNVLDLRTENTAGQSGINDLPAVALKNRLIQAPTYQSRIRNVYDFQEPDRAAALNVPFIDAIRKGHWQAHNQFLRYAALWGHMPENGEGILTNAAQVDLPPDSQGTKTIHGYIAGDFVNTVLVLISKIKTRTRQVQVSGAAARESAPLPVTILTSPAVKAWMDARQVNFTQYAEAGSTDNITDNLITKSAKQNVALTIGVDPTMAGKGPKATTPGTQNDPLHICIPNLPETGNEDGDFDTNEFGDKFINQARLCNAQYVDLAAPGERQRPDSGFDSDFSSWRRFTPGWPVRPESNIVLNVPVPAIGNSFVIGGSDEN